MGCTLAHQDDPTTLAEVAGPPAAAQPAAGNTPEVPGGPGFQRRQEGGAPEQEERLRLCEGRRPSLGEVT